MFTIKFYSYFEGESNIEVVLSAPHYEVYTHSDGVKSVTIYKDYLSVEGVEYKVVPDSLAEKLNYTTNHYQVCFIENQSGKTIARIASK